MNKYLSVYDVCDMLDIGTSKAYKIIRQFNDELKKQGYYTITGQIDREYFNPSLWGLSIKFLDV